MSLRTRKGQTPVRAVGVRRASPLPPFPLSSWWAGRNAQGSFNPANFCSDANGVLQFQPWATPKVRLNRQTGALKARLIRLHPIPNIAVWHGDDETRFQRFGVRFRVTLGRCPRLELTCAFGAPDAISGMSLQTKKGQTPVRAVGVRRASPLPLLSSWRAGGPRPRCI